MTKDFADNVSRQATTEMQVGKGSSRPLEPNDRKLATKVPQNLASSDFLAGLFGSNTLRVAPFAVMPAVIASNAIVENTTQGAKPVLLFGVFALCASNLQAAKRASVVVSSDTVIEVVRVVFEQRIVSLTSHTDDVLSSLIKR